ncbi:hypothetical protein [Teredinibacter turnerae]|uniref:hypothetical protein n=1 Tax=Teredinibacter turnerae TaxID=2426 RepID=UPI0003763767|nr:hypothetical protein [Teredinibacter turnerae]
MRKIPILGVLLCSTFIITTPVFAEPAESPIVQLITQMADTPADHKALAEYYRAKAESAREEIALHKSMKLSYSRRGNTKSKGVDFNSSMQKHCESLIASFETAASDYESLAKLHMQKGMHH